MTDDHSTDPALPPERARIEPSPPPKHRDTLPILYLVGFLILAGSLVYIWRHPTLPTGVMQQTATLRQDVDSRTQEVAALAARLAQLESRPAPAPAPAVDLAPLDARLKALEAQPAAAVPAAPDLRPLEGRIAALEARPLPAPPPNLAPLESRIAAVEARRPPPPVDLGPLEGKVGTVERRQGEIAGKLDAVDGKVGALERRQGESAGKLDALEPRLAAVDAQAKQTASGLAAITDRAQRSQRLIVANAALEAGQRLGEIPGAPPALAKFALDAPPTESALRLSFNQAADAAHRASQPAITDNQPLLDRMWTRAQQSVTVRQGERVLVGDPIAGVIASARQALDAGDLAGSVKALSGLSGPARAAMADWIVRAQSLLDARAALAEMASR